MPEDERPRGAPAHTGSRPPSYPAHPLGCPSVREGDEFASLTPHVLLDGYTVGGLTVRATSVRGDSHNWEGGCRQDAMAVTRIGPPEAEMLLLAVADGVGSARYSHLGSHDAVRLAARQLDRAAEGVHAALRSGDDAALRELAGRAVAGVVAGLRAEGQRRAYEAERPYQDGDHSTTLHVLLVPTDPHIRERALLGVGDGGHLLLRDGTWLREGTGDEAVLDTRTEALPHAYRKAGARILRAMAGDVLLLGTDGITNPLTQKDPAFRTHLAAAWGVGGAPSLSDFLWQAQTRAKSYDDDRTVICLWEGSA
ncbi:protein phosphatase 2C domain-containing protein [Streptomyces lichenis]|uniref:Protein phosphatase 2C domain-containing protein n=1 Tax=Streptomyces lichenis TaxID=2306967 RepID=A0ABT0I3X1_9ACTN|nr:protein phosphatase 2C domain-containing protein [Streptomyces lichenis]MCK8676019.1 protein phosphatase 2C domain-containing protein [Streptomyces lichenis]